MWLAMEIEDFPNWFEWQQSCFELIQIARGDDPTVSFECGKSDSSDVDGLDIIG